MIAIHLPNFAFAAATCTVLLTGVIVWILIDPQCSDGVDLAAIYLRLSPHPGFKQSIMDEVHAELRGRIWLLVVLSPLVILSWTLMLGRLFIDSSGGRSIAAMLAATAVTAGWLCLFTQFDRFQEYSIVWRIKRQVPELKLLAERLRASWPIESIEIPPYGEFRGDEEHPNLVMTPDSEPPLLAEKLSHFAYKRGDTILFEFRPDFDSPFYIEFHQGATRPNSFKEEFPEFTIRYELDSFEAVSEGVYLSRYRNLTEFHAPELEELLAE